MSEEDDIVDKVREWFFNDETWSIFEDFANEHCGIFDSVDEQKLEYTVLYQKFQQVFESKVEEFCVSQGSTVEEFQNTLAKKVQHDADTDMFVQVMLAMTDYESFIELMHERKSGKHI
eukprot:GILK01007052.1.p1 GENE.GILK01007052.1~~GILK01007052.1.p1  ORF type:complete len:127 (+),score=25.94 GILK01007052.1:30-383(+)